MSLTAEKTETPVVGRVARPPAVEREQVAGLAVQRRADRLERRKANSARLARLEDRQVRERDADLPAELREGHVALLEQAIERYVDCHD